MTAIYFVGAGFSSAVIARELADNGLRCIVVEERDHVAGNCHTSRDSQTGITVHRYGPHIFHTDKAGIWAYIQRFGEMMPYINRVKTTVGGQVYSLPINLHTINQFFGKAMSPSEAEAFVRSRADATIETPRNFEEQALKSVGRELYEAFFHGYTLKQWGVEPRQLPASILKRLPLRFTYNDNYYDHRYQGMPRNGYTAIVERILEHPGIEVRLNTRFEDLDRGPGHAVYSGAIDRYFDFDLGRLGYRTLRFEERRARGTFQGTAVMNYGDAAVPFTRVTEHKFFSPWELETYDNTIYYVEFSGDCGPDDIPYYPIRLVEEKKLLAKYVERAEGASGVTFVGRLGTYQYLDMDMAIERAIETAGVLLDRLKASRPLPVFVHRPI